MADLRKAREKAGLRLAEAAKKAGMSQTVLRMLEDGVFRPTAHETALLGQLYAPATSSRTTRDASGQGHLFEGSS